MALKSLLKLGYSIHFSVMFRHCSFFFKKKQSYKDALKRYRKIISVSLQQLQSSLEIKHCTNKVGPQPPRIFGIPLDSFTQGASHCRVPSFVKHTVEYLEAFGKSNAFLFHFVATRIFLPLKSNHWAHGQNSVDQDTGQEVTQAALPEQICTTLIRAYAYYRCVIVLTLAVSIGLNRKGLFRIHGSSRNWSRSMIKETRWPFSMSKM